MTLYSIPSHDEHPQTINTIIEIPKGTSAKYEYDVVNNVFKLDRCLMSAMVYPASYGFIPSTLAEDGDALDVIVYNSIPIDRGTLVECNVIGCLNMTDDGDPDYKILASPVSHVKQYNTIDEIDPVFLTVAENFFQHYKDLDDKQVITDGWLRRQDTYNIISRASEAYDTKNRHQEHLHFDIR